MTRASILALFQWWNHQLLRFGWRETGWIGSGHSKWLVSTGPTGRVEYPCCSFNLFRLASEHRKHSKASTKFSCSISSVPWPEFHVRFFMASTRFVLSTRPTVLCSIKCPYATSSEFNLMRSDAKVSGDSKSQTDSTELLFGAQSYSQVKRVIF